jgi:hypothetical protein
VTVTVACGKRFQVSVHFLSFSEERSEVGRSGLEWSAECQSPGYVTVPGGRHAPSARNRLVGPAKKKQRTPKLFGAQMRFHMVYVPNGVLDACGNREAVQAAWRYHMIFAEYSVEKVEVHHKETIGAPLYLNNCNASAQGIIARETSASISKLNPEGKLVQGFLIDDADERTENSNFLHSMVIPYLYVNVHVRSLAKFKNCRYPAI